MKRVLNNGAARSDEGEHRSLGDLDVADIKPVSSTIRRRREGRA